MKNMDINKAFAENLKTLREQHNLSLRSLADEVGISFQALSYYENCQRDPSISIVKKIADYFNKTVDEMIGG